MRSKGKMETLPVAFTIKELEEAGLRKVSTNIRDNYSNKKHFRTSGFFINKPITIASLAESCYKQKLGHLAINQESFYFLRVDEHEDFYLFMIEMF